MQIEIPEKFEAAILSDSRWVIAKGGRGSGKSWSMSELMVAKMLTDGKPRLCTRPVQKSIRDSSHKLIAGAIKRLGLESSFEIQRDYIKLRRNGAEFIFTGMRDVKSMEGVQDVWIEEAQDATSEMIQDLAPTIRSEGSQIYATYNPKNDDDPIHIRATDDAFEGDRTVVTMNWRDNPWFPKVLESDRLSMKAFNLDLYNHVWEGQTLKQVEGAIIKAEYFNYYSKLPTITRSMIIADTAIKAEDEHDYTVYLFAGLGVDGNVYLMDLWRDKVESLGRETRAVSFWNKHKRDHLYGIGASQFKIEDAASGSDLIQRLKPRGIPVSGITRKRSASGFKAKFGRLTDVFVKITGTNGKRGKVYLPESSIHYSSRLVTDASWVDEFIKECQQFRFDDKHENDDQVDVLIDAVTFLGGGGSSAMSILGG